MLFKRKQNLLNVPIYFITKKTVPDIFKEKNKRSSVYGFYSVTYDGKNRSNPEIFIYLDKIFDVDERVICYFFSKAVLHELNHYFIEELFPYNIAVLDDEEDKVVSMTNSLLINYW